MSEQKTETVRVVGYRRDRSFYASRPSESHTPKLHRESVTRPGMAACDTSWILLETEKPITLMDDAEQRMSWCLRCFPVGQDPLYRSGSTGSEATS